MNRKRTNKTKHTHVYLIENEFYLQESSVSFEKNNKNSIRIIMKTIVQERE